MEEIIKIFGVIASLFALYKIIVDVVLARSSKHREECQFSKDYLKDLNEGDVHPFVLEKGFLALTGNIYSMAEIKYLLSYPNPYQMIKYRVSSDEFVEFDANNSSYVWRGKYKKSIIRRSAQIWFMMCYVFFASLAISPLYVNVTKIVKGTPLVVFCVSLGIIAIAYLINFSDFKSARKLIPEGKHI